MMKHTTSYLLALVLLMAFGACSSHKTDTNKQEGDTVKFKYAQLLQIVDFDDHSEVTIFNPWKPGKVLHTYTLSPINAQPSALNPQHSTLNPPHSTLHTPLTRSAVFTTVHCALLMSLGRQEAIAGVADLQYIKIPWIHQQVAEGKIADCGGGLSPVVEKIMDIKPDAILLSPFENSGGYGKVEDLGIPIIECAEYMEPSPLARAEWMKFYGRLYGCEAQADSLFAVVDSSYHALCDKARKLGPGRRVLIDKMAGNVWYVPGGKSTIGQMLKDAGGLYPWADDDHSGSLALPFETVLEKAADCEVWLYRFSAKKHTTLSELQSEFDGYKMLTPFKNGEVYGCNVDQSLFYEEAPFRPDFLLDDFISIVHPDGSDHQLRYYQKVK